MALRSRCKSGGESTAPSKIADDFNVHDDVYAQPQNIDSYMNSSLTLAQP